MSIHSEVDFVKIKDDWMELKETFVRHGFTFESKTDTEVIPKLAKFVFDKANEEGDQTVTFSEVVLEVMRHLEAFCSLVSNYWLIISWFYGVTISLPSREDALLHKPCTFLIPIVAKTSNTFNDDGISRTVG
ncbi:hypothetical protein F0562_014466 [Nyssa sinensis]|uniref:Uncharacterized protein n=1 Tax=Nyssa sinensis TaxID=561372 RepID=A0A5J4ZNS3_9ASTE|nr:hypothetical protein F0562_014466 [Nyssa sinensis]